MDPGGFNKEWLVTYGLKVSQKESATISFVICLFCSSFGRDEEQHTDQDLNEIERKRSRTTLSKYFSRPWRTDYFAEHLKSQHPARWARYKALGIERKEVYFAERERPGTMDIRAFAQPGASARAQQMAEQQLEYSIDKDIVNDLIGNLLFDADNELINGTTDFCSIQRAKKTALEIFRLDPAKECYIVSQGSILQMKLVVSFLSNGLSLRQTHASIGAVKKILECGNIGTVNETTVSCICRAVCAINLQYLKELFKKVWAFSIGFDAANHMRSSYLDVRMRCYYNGELHNLHLMAIPMRERHTGEYQFQLVVSLLNVLAPNWRYQLIGVTTDGASNNTGRISGTVTRLNQEVHSHVFRIWCGAHQLDLVVKKALRTLCNSDFLGVLKGVTKHLRQQQILIQDMDNEAAKSFVETRWISMGPALKWLTEHEERLMIHFEAKKPPCSPPKDFWIIIAVINPIVKRIEQTFTAIQGQRTLVCEQRDQLLDLVHNLMTRTNVKQPITDEEQGQYEALQNLKDTQNGESDDENEVDQVHGCVANDYYVLETGALLCIDEMGGIRIQNKMDALKDGSDSDKELYYSIIDTISNFSLTLVQGIQEVVAERDGSNTVAGQLPPVLPVALCEMSSRSFAASLTLQKSRLLHHVSESVFNEIDEQFRNLCLRYKEDKTFCLLLKSNAQKANIEHFKNCWLDVGQGFECLQQYCGGLASVMAGTASVESDFSLINWTKDLNSSSMTDFTLESILHSKQHEKLVQMFRK